MAPARKQNRLHFGLCSLAFVLLLTHRNIARACETEVSSPVPVQSKSFFANAERKIKRVFAHTERSTTIPEPPHGCDEVYLRNIKELTSDVGEVKTIAKAAVLIDTPKTAGKYGLVVIAKKLGYLSAESAVGGMFVIEGAADILATLEIAGFFYAENKPLLTGMTKSYQIILQAETGGGPEFDKFYKMLGADNPKWTAKDGMTKEVFRQIIIDMDKHDELCTNVAGYTLRELSDLFNSMSDNEVTFFQNEAPADLKLLEERAEH